MLLLNVLAFVAIYLMIGIIYPFGGKKFVLGWIDKYTTGWKGRYDFLGVETFKKNDKFLGFSDFSKPAQVLMRVLWPVHMVHFIKVWSKAMEEWSTMTD